MGEQQKQHRRYMLEAIKASIDNIQDGGGPFGAVIVKDGKVVAKATNTVTTTNDPTAHAEINAIRQACQKLQTFDLSGCVIYCSCQPCPMCLSAIYWARIDKVFYANEGVDAANIGFDDEAIAIEVKKDFSNVSIHPVQVCHEEALEAFRLWEKTEDKVEY